MARDDLGQKLKNLWKKSSDGDVGSLARLLSLVEDDIRVASPFLGSLKANPKAVRLGITGPPGAGKSTLINLLVDHLSVKGMKVCVLAVDPSSPFSGGALLGDRVRMESQRNVFIRSLGSRGGLGGLSSATGAMATVLESIGYDVILIETVGVGQTELQIMNTADAIAVVLVPESGDVIQTLKAGILEIADVFVVNKSDRPGAEALFNELETLKKDTFLTSAKENKGVGEFASKLFELGQELKKKRRASPERLRGELRNLVLEVVQENLEKKISKEKITNLYKSFQKFRIPT